MTQYILHVKTLLCFRFLRANANLQGVSGLKAQQSQNVLTQSCLLPRAHMGGISSWQPVLSITPPPAVSLSPSDNVFRFLEI